MCVGGGQTKSNEDRSEVITQLMPNFVCILSINTHLCTSFLDSVEKVATAHRQFQLNFVSSTHAEFTFYTNLAPLDAQRIYLFTLPEGLY